MQAINEGEFLSFVEEIVNWDSTREKFNRNHVLGISLGNSAWYLKSKASTELKDSNSIF